MDDAATAADATAAAGWVDSFAGATASASGSAADATTAVLLTVSADAGVYGDGWLE